MKIAGSVHAGFPSPAEEENVDLISLDEWLVEDKNATFMYQVDDDSMSGSGILSGDLVLIQRGKQPKNYDIILAAIDENYTVKHFLRKGQTVFLLPSNKNYYPLRPRYKLQIEGVVIAVIRKI